MASQMNNLFLVNAPAGSGKTTQIKAMMQQLLIDSPNDNILCITYTNRAADEISKEITSPNIFVGTIHSFFHKFIGPYLSHKKILDLYFSLYEDDIKSRIENPKGDKHITESNNRYIEEFGGLSYEIVKNNIDRLFYNESPFSSLYYGGLSHDDLIVFSKHIADRYPVIKKRISSKYQVIIIDEYQDTIACVLDLFFESVKNTDTQLYLFGDKMQQIYKNYDGSFEDKFILFDTSKSLGINYRSIPKIVDILNNIYNDPTYKQQYYDEMKKERPDFDPQIIISENINLELEKLQSGFPESLVLYLLNKERFSAIGSIDLYNSIDKMEKYSYGKTYSAVDVLITESVDNPDPLIKLLYIIAGMFHNYKNSKFGLIIQEFRANKSIFNQDSWNIVHHKDKLDLRNKLIKIFNIYDDGQNNIRNLLDILNKTEIITPEYLKGIIADGDYDSVLNVSLDNVHAIIDYLNNPTISTQHGVKGESHDSVIFVAEDSNRNPVVHMYKFFDMWSRIDISLNSFQQLYYSYSAKLSLMEESIGMKINDLRKDTYQANESFLISEAKEILEQFKEDRVFDYLCASKYKRFLEKPGVTRAKDCFKENLIYGPLSAYKLFYVGCSRARKNLTILVDKSKVQGDLDLLIDKFKKIGFTVKNSI
ncbi:MAG TPA: ATP-dependent helicase [Syntrophomonadaceae bacterium]|nr:ATP-dependent helicase [Syntrophomonadaceae bacterium]